jgi:4-aminobutyrate aminotransferase-like enzyme/Ser/Thr protein kinase RdoA (MazF antagonist)
MSIATCPIFDETEALKVLHDFWGLSGTLKPLDSYLDQNFMVKTPEGQKYVLKIANIETPQNWLDLQNKVMEHLLDTSIPKVIAAKNGEGMIFYQLHWWRVLNFLEGNMLSTIPYKSNDLLTEIGTFVGTISHKLSTFNHEAANRPIQWDLQLAEKLITEWVDFIDDQTIKDNIITILNSWKSKQEAVSQLRKSIIHADLTRYNLLLDNKAKKVQGVIDFGDVCLSWTIGELAVLVLESAMTDSPNPFEDAYQVVKAYHAIFPLTKTEIELLYLLIQLRSAVIVSASARQLSIEPLNEYVKKQAIADRKMFMQLTTEKRHFATTLFLKACGFLDDTNILTPFFEQHSIEKIIHTNQNIPVIDISPASDIFDDGAWLDDGSCQNKIASLLNEGFGRTTYLSPTIKNSHQGFDNETIALGIFLFLPKDTPILAPFDMELISKTENKTVFKIEHFYLNLYALETGLSTNTFIKTGQKIGHSKKEKTRFGNAIFIQIDLSGNAPQYCNVSEVNIWKSLCYNPNVLLGLPQTAFEWLPSTKHLSERRQQNIQQAQEYYYEKPMNLVRGWQQYLIADDGKVYLDAINNVTHLGHSHPKITAAACQQLRKLNTNARFLFEQNIDYAEKLLRHFPPSLNVVFYTCSGSEANDLALRLARAYTNENDIIVIDGEYHGNTTAVDEISTCLMDNPTASKSIRPFTHPLIQPNTFRGKYDAKTPDVATLYAQNAKDTIANIQKQGRNVAAFISESLLGSGGGVEMPKGYLKQVYQAVHEAGGVCIADEVQIGFGRMGTHFWGFEKEGVLPDIVTLGKPMGNGHPVSAVVTTKAIASAYQKKYTYFNTFAGSPVSTQIANTVLDVIEAESLQENANVVGQFFKSALETLVDDYDMVGAIYGHAFYLGVDIVENKKTKKPAPEKAMLICEAMQKKGVIVYPTGDYYNILKIKPPMCFTKENASFFVESLKSILDVMAD